MVVNGQGEEGKNEFASYSPKNYIERILPQEIEIIAHISGIQKKYCMQDMYIAKKSEKTTLSGSELATNSFTDKENKKE